MDWTPGAACRAAAELCDRHDMHGALVVMLDKGADGNMYSTFMRQAGLQHSEIVALLEIMKNDIICEMKGQPPTRNTDA